MSKATQLLVQLDRNKLIRRKRVLEILDISNTWFYAKLFVGGPYYDETMPRPIYFPKSRIPYWREADVYDWIAAAERQSQQRTQSEVASVVSRASVAASTSPQTESPETPSSNKQAGCGETIIMMNDVDVNGRAIQVPMAFRKKRALSLSVVHAASMPRLIPTLFIPAGTVPD